MLNRIPIWLILIDTHYFWRNFSTIKGELIPYILKKQLSPGNKLPTNNDASVEITPIKDPNEKKRIGILENFWFVSNNVVNLLFIWNVFVDLFTLAKDDEYDSMARSMSSFNDHSGDLHPVYLNDNIKCYSYAVKEFGIRTNTLHDYCKANRVVRAINS